MNDEKQIEHVESSHDKPLSTGAVIAISTGAIIGFGGLWWLGQREAAVKEQEEVVEYKAELATMDSSELLRELNEWQFRNRGVRNNTDTLVLMGYMIFGALLTAR